MISLLRSLEFFNVKARLAKQKISVDWHDRYDILSSSVNLFCWSRKKHLQTTQYLNRLNDETLPSIKLTVDTSSIQEKLQWARARWDKTCDQQGDWFWLDVQNLAIDFITLTKSDFGILHLKQVENDGCPQFHTDAFKYRLFTTYTGPGTEWLPEIAVNRNGLGKSNDLIIKDAAQIHSMETFEVGILKGELPNQIFGTAGIVHRSPPIKNSGIRRLILRVDV